MTTTHTNFPAPNRAVAAGAITVGTIPVIKSATINSRDRTPAEAVQSSDEALLQRIAAGDKLAMQAFYGRHRVRVYRFALRQLGNATTAEDVTSDVFVDVWRQAGRFEGRSAVTTWLLSITRFKALSVLRRRPEEELNAETAEMIEDPADDPQAALEKRDRGAAIRQCLTKLSAPHRQIIDLVYYHEKSIQEAAEIVGIPEATVKTRMFYARKKLAELLKADGIEGFAE